MGKLVNSRFELVNDAFELVIENSHYNFHYLKKINNYHICKYFIY